MAEEEATPGSGDEPPVREFADRGTLWLLESPENVRGLLALVARDLADRLDFSRAERINRSFVPDDLHKQEADLLYRVPFREGSAGEVFVYVLLEHQSRPDRTRTPKRPSRGGVCTPSSPSSSTRAGGAGPRPRLASTC